MTRAGRGDAALASYYAQKLDWKKCGDLECADLRVPLDHAAPDPSKDLTIKVARVKARDQANRLGSLLVNPGGPGASGIDYVRGGAETIGGPNCWSRRRASGCLRRRGCAPDSSRASSQVRTTALEIP